MREFIRTRLRRTLVGIPLIVGLLAMSVSLSGCKALFQQSATAPTPAKSAASKLPPHVPTGAEKFASATTSLTASLDAAERALKTGKRDGIALAGVAAFAKALPALDKGVQADFAKTRGILAKVKSPAKDAIEAKVEKQYAEREVTLASKLSAVGSAESTAALKAAVAETSKWLASITPQQPYQPLGTQLPNRIVNAHAGPPVRGTSIAPAYAPNTKGAEPSALPITPTDADTSTTVEVQFTDDLRSLATSLGNDPVRMYEYVRNTIDFEPYYGSRKGAEETLLEGSGNDMDTASLLIALYRVSGIPARYVSGVVDIPIAKAENWVGVETPEAAAKLFAVGGTPAKIVLSGGRPTSLQIRHTWAETFVPYESYRGAGARSGADRWVPLDGSWKTYEADVRAPDLIAGLDASAGALASTTIDPGSGALTSFDTTGAMLEFGRASAEASVAASTGDRGRFAKAIRRSISALTVQELPSRLPMVAIPNSESREVPDSLRETVEFDLGGESVTMPVAALRSALFHVGFQCATPQDDAIAAQPDQLSSLPAYLVNVRPTLESDGKQLIFGQSASALGDPVTMTVRLHSPGFETQEIPNSLVAGGRYSVFIDRGRVARTALARTDAALHQDESAEIASSPNQFAYGAVEDAGDKVLDGALQTYFVLVHAARVQCSAAMAVDSLALTSAGTAGLDVETQDLLGQPMALNPSGLFLDIRGLNTAAVAADARTNWQTSFGLAYGSFASLAESTTWDLIYPDMTPAVSTVRILAQCMNAGVPIQYIDHDSSERIARLPYSDALRKDLLTAINAGYSVVIPDGGQGQQFGDDVGYVVVDPITGSAGFMIGQGFGGSKKKFSHSINPAPGPSAMAGGVWDVWSLLVLIAAAGVKLSAGATALLATGLALPSVYVMSLSLISYLDWLGTSSLSQAQREAAIAQAVAIFIALTAVALASIFMPLPYAILTQIAVSGFGTAMFLAVLPIEVDLVTGDL